MSVQSLYKPKGEFSTLTQPDELDPIHFLVNQKYFEYDELLDNEGNPQERRKYLTITPWRLHKILNDYRLHNYFYYSKRYSKK